MQWDESGIKWIRPIRAINRTDFLVVWTYIDHFDKRYAKKTKDRNLNDAIKNADVFLGLSSADVLKRK